MDLVDMDKFLVKTDTFTTFKHTLNMCVIKFSVSLSLGSPWKAPNLANLPELAAGGSEAAGQVRHMVQGITEKSRKQSSRKRWE